MTGQESAAAIHAQARTGQPPSLDRIRALLAALDDPEKKLRFVHIAGTNGKGSTAAMLSSILTQAGLRTGLYTSPHLCHFSERIQVDGAPVPEEVLGPLTRRVLRAAGAVSSPPTEFELITALGLLCFLEAGCSLVVLEAGLGGRLDATNAIAPPEAAVITNIGLEHTGVLGATLTQIAREKAGILKAGSRCVLYAQGEEASQVVRSTCRERAIPLLETAPEELEVLSSTLEGQTFRYRGEGPFHIGLLGAHQLRNAMAALDAVRALGEAGWSIPEEAVVRGLTRARWPGRLELVRRAPDLIIDGGHNPQCVEALAAALGALYPGKKLIFLAGVLGDKDWRAMFGRILPLAGAFVLSTPDSPRALPAPELAGWLRQNSAVPVHVRDTLAEGLETALSLAGPEGVVCAWGSLYSAGALRALLGLC